MPLRPDLVGVWVYRPRSIERPTDLEVLLVRRSPDRPLPGLWQCVTGAIEDGERVVQAAVRELAEETGIGPESVEVLYDLDLVSLFHWPGVDSVLAEVIFAARVRAGTEPVLSHEHDDMRWVSTDEAIRLSVWPAYREAIGRIVDLALDTERARWFETTLEGDRVMG